MKDWKIIEAMAKLEGMWRNDIPVMQMMYGGPAVKVGTRCSEICELPEYLSSHDACQRVIDGLSNIDLDFYDHILAGIVDTSSWGCRIHKATPRQKCEAILKALGKWEGDVE